MLIGGIAWRWGLVALLLAPLGPGLAVAQEFRVPAERLLDQSTAPFLFLGKKVEPGNNHWSDYRRFLRRYPDVPSCLVEDERDSPNPDLLRLDWGALNDTRAVEVCLWRIFVNFDDPEMVADYLVASGAYQIAIEDRQTMAIERSVISRWDVASFRNKTNNNRDFFATLLGIEAHLVMISAGYGADGRMSNSSVSFHTK